MIDLAWPIVALMFLLLAFALAWRYFDARVRFRDLAAEQARRMGELTDEHARARTAALMELDSLQKRVRQLELTMETHQAAHQGM